MSVKGELAKNYFENGYNCAQAVALAFLEETKLEEQTLLTLTSGLGGGIGRLRGTCGAIVGAGIVMSLLYGKARPNNVEKMQIYQNIQEIGKRFIAQNGSIICAELLGINKGPDSPQPSERTSEYYKKRPCALLCYDTASYIEDFIKTHPIIN